MSGVDSKQLRVHRTNWENPFRLNVDFTVCFLRHTHTHTQHNISNSIKRFNFFSPPLTRIHAEPEMCLIEPSIRRGRECGSTFFFLFHVMWLINHWSQTRIWIQYTLIHTPLKAREEKKNYKSKKIEWLMIVSRFSLGAFCARAFPMFRADKEVCKLLMGFDGNIVRLFIKILGPFTCSPRNEFSFF